MPERSYRKATEEDAEAIAAVAAAVVEELGDTNGLPGPMTVGAVTMQIGGFGKNAAILAGYSLARAKQTAHELLRRPDVAAAVSKGSAEIVERSGMDADWFLAQFLGTCFLLLLKDA